MMNTYLKSISLALIGLPCVASADRPNIVIMMVDDMGIGDTSAYLGRSLMPGSPPIELTQRTPSLDDFAKRSIVFTDAHAGASMCSSSRYSLLTGRFDAKGRTVAAVLSGGNVDPSLFANIIGGGGA